MDIKYEIMTSHSQDRQKENWFGQHSTDFGYLPDPNTHDWVAEVTEISELLAQNDWDIENPEIPEGWELGDDIRWDMSKDVGVDPEDPETMSVEFRIEFVEMVENERGLAEERKHAGRPVIGKATSITLRPDQMGWLNSQLEPNAAIIRDLIDEAMGLA